MKNFKKKYFVKIPKNIQIIYCDKKNLITFVGPLSIKSLRLQIKVFLISSPSLIVTTHLPAQDKSVRKIKDIKKIQGSTIAKIKQILIEISYTLHCKLNLVGVGYRVFTHEKLTNQIFLKLGYSHLIFFKIPPGIGLHILKFTKMFFFGNIPYNVLTQTIAQIRTCKLPEPYKGKGILYDQEKIILKKGKKI